MFGCSCGPVHPRNQNRVLRETAKLQCDCEQFRAGGRQRLLGDLPQCAGVRHEDTSGRACLMAHVPRVSLLCAPVSTLDSFSTTSGSVFTSDVVSFVRSTIT